jgi:hypothetical protein
MPLVGIEPTIPESERLQTSALELAASGIGLCTSLCTILSVIRR